MAPFASLRRRAAPPEPPPRYPPEPVQVATSRPAPPGALPVMDYGLLDDVPPPRQPDVTVFGDWQPAGPVPVMREHACRCGCGQPATGPCWNCGATVTPWQWLA